MRFHALDVRAFNRVAKPYRLPLHNQELVLVEGENRDGGALIPGNGAGKSLCVVEALTWAVHGRMVRHGDRQVTTEATHPQRGAHALLDVELRGLLHRLERRRAPSGSPQFTVTVQDPATGAWSPLPQSKDPHRNTVEALLGLDYAAFRYAVVVQGADALAAGGFAQQMAVLETLLRLDELGAASEEARTRTTKRERDLAVARAEVAGAERSLAEAQQLLADLDSLATAGQQDRAAEEAALQRRRAEAVEATILLPKLREVVAATAVQMDRARQEVIVANSAATPLIKEQQQVEKRRDSLVCPTCNRPYGTPAEAEKQRAKAAARLEEITAELRAQGKKKDQADREFQTLHLRQRAQEDEVRKLERAAGALADVDAQLAALVERDKERARQRELLESRLAELTATLGERTKVRDQLVQWHGRSAVWVAGYGRDGLQADLFALGVPELNRAAERYSAALAGTHLRVRFNPQRESRREHLITVEGATAPTYEGCSAGEKERINLIVAFSLRALARWRLGEPINFSVFDECFDRVDPGGLKAIADLLQAEVAANGGSIFVITHNPTLKALFPGAKLMRVVREGGEATVYYG